MKSAPLKSGIYPFRARYGVKDNMHALLEFNGDLASLPSELLGLTDKPPGYVTPGERWWPSVGCCPLGSWWVLWWTVPDENATRGGMVRSEVALWPRDMVPTILSLAAVMEELNGGQRIEAPSERLLKMAAEALIKASESTPIIGDLDAWPGLLAALWRRLWPEARLVFSARVAISPPQGGESVSPPLLLGVSASRVNQWPPGDIVADSTGSGEFNRAADWLIGKPDEGIEQLLTGGALCADSISSLRGIARAADRIELLRGCPDASSAIDALRTLCAIAPGASAAQVPKRESLAVIEQTLPVASLQAVLSLANFKEQDVPSSEILSNSVHRWTLAQLPMLVPSDLFQLIEVMTAGKGEKWWLSAIQGAIAAGILLREEHWYRATFICLCHSTDLAAFAELRSQGVEAETNVLAIAERTTCVVEQFVTLRQNSTTLQWSRLHAWALYKSQSADTAIAQQLSFKPSYLPGLLLLVERIPGAQLVAAAVALGDDRVLEPVTTRTRKTPSLMRDMDLSLASWRTLWSLHVVQGGDPWPAGIDRKQEMMRFLTASLRERPRDGVIQRLAVDFATVAIGFPGRTNLWGALNAHDAQSLADHTAVLLLNDVEHGTDVGVPEPYMQDAVFKALTKSSLSAGTVATLLSWEPNLYEYNARSRIDQVVDWGKGAAKLGALIRVRRWRSIADNLYKRYVNGETGILAALEECKDQLSFWQSYRFSTLCNVDAPALSVDVLIDRVAELGGDLAADRLDDVWQRAGGKKKQLLSQGTAAQRWNEAARSAAQGGLNGGLRALVDVLADDLPYNSDLRELRASLSSLNRPNR
jgi:hypothetical protein